MPRNSSRYGIYNAATVTHFCDRPRAPRRKIRRDFSAPQQHRRRIIRPLNVHRGKRTKDHGRNYVRARMSIYIYINIECADFTTQVERIIILLRARSRGKIRLRSRRRLCNYEQVPCVRCCAAAFLSRSKPAGGGRCFLYTSVAMAQGSDREVKSARAGGKNCRSKIAEGRRPNYLLNFSKPPRR